MRLAMQILLVCPKYYGWEGEKHVKVITVVYLMDSSLL